MVKEQTDYSKVLEDVRHIYKQKYNVVMDDELLYIIIRINEMHVAVNKKIENIPRVTFRSGKDYFLYSIGKFVPFLILGIGLILISCYLFLADKAKSIKTYEIIEQERGSAIRLNRYNSVGDTVLYLTKQK